MNFVNELEWRGMIHDIMPGTKEMFDKELVTAYVGIDPTADSLHIGHLVSIMMLKHLQVNGHKPIVVLGGATGMVGDPSGKSNERNLLDENTLQHNEDCIRKQIARFLDFSENSPSGALLVNNYSWMKNYSFLEFVRDIGKHITVNYMMAKDSVKKRLSGDSIQGMSFTEFSYQLLQGYDFVHLYREHGCKLQMGGSDQWGNITTGTELIRRIEKADAYALTCPLITKSDGGKFGKTEEGNIWLDPNKTSAYKFYQFWLNTSDEDAAKYIKIFTLLNKEEINSIIAKHSEAPHIRLLQKKLAEEITCMVHGRAEYDNSLSASEILFGKSTELGVFSLNEQTILSVFEGVPQFTFEKNLLKSGIPVVDLLTDFCSVFPSKAETRRTIQGSGLSINRQKISDLNIVIDVNYLISNKFIIVQKGKKDYYLLIAK
ncbi:MAG: tyrosine--tRNA ligase [Bacteroidales bacterium]|nr:tyrosine--tRNA ligase [Bacteroidales bacterium]HOY38362.1 tyrosine--tRNA ligase [Bacteroidales bacterium]HQP04425.1 tyrosine--tRNA ligase [Bacteroidales bacterium]